MRKPNMKNITANVGAAAIVVVEPAFIGGEKVANVAKRRGRSIKTNFQESKKAITEHREDKARAKAMAEVQPHIDAVEERCVATK